MCPIGAHSLKGNGHDTNQNCDDFVVRACGRNPQNTLSPPEPILCDGSGLATVSPKTVDGNTDTTFTVTFKPDPAQSIADMRIIFPHTFTWSHNISSVLATNMSSANASVIADTILFEGVSFSSDSAQIAISNVTTPDSNGRFLVQIQTRCSSFRDVSPAPYIDVFGSPIPIGDIKIVDSVGMPVMNGRIATVKGIVTVSNEFGSPSYIQDITGGIAVFGTIFSSSVQTGDEVIVSGTVQPFNGLTELVNLFLRQIVSSGNEVDPLVITTNQMNEEVEGQLVKMLSVVVRDTFGNPISTWAVSGSGANYRLYDATGYTQIRVDNNVDFANTPAPQDEFDVMGVVSQFDNSSPFFSGYQLMPRKSTDIKSCGPSFSTLPTESNLQQTSVTINWTTRRNSSSFVQYGLTKNYEIGFTGDITPTTNHSVTILGLSPATIYQVRAYSDSSSDTCFSNNLVVSTTSPSGSTGEINVYFNKSVFTELSTGTPAQGNTNFVQKLLNRINNAKRTIDVALYSFSGANVGDLIASALVSAKINRGIKIRVAGEKDNGNSNAFNTLAQNGIPVIFDDFGSNTGAGLMHNKFFVFDSRGGAPESVWVWTGSYNTTEPGTNNDMQNVIEIQDVALAGAYTREFEELWGSNTETPNSLFSRFGTRKLNDTPHKFIINGKNVENYFSPSDRAARRLLHALSSATSDVEFATYSFTRNDIADSLIALKNHGKHVRGVMDNSSDLGNVYSRLTTGGVDVKLKVNASGLLHHKYGIIDALNTNALSYVWTGSMNWTNSGEGSNDENVVFVQDNSIANQYLQEFAQRYYDFGGTDSIHIITGVAEIPGNVPSEFSLGQNYPNPFNPTTKINFSLPKQSKVTLTVFNILGEKVVTLLDNASTNAGSYEVQLDASKLASGIYFYQLATPSFSATHKMMVLK